jgi:hypothetical protein
MQGLPFFLHAQADTGSKSLMTKSYCSIGIYTPMTAKNETHAIQFVLNWEGHFYISLNAADEYVYIAIFAQFGVYISGTAQMAITCTLYGK